MEKFHSFRELTQFATPGEDYLIEWRKGVTGMAIMAPHGGRIEPGTAAAADAIAGTEHAYYAFKGIRPRNNRQLHIPSTRFDEPCAVELIQSSHTIVTVHGCRDAGDRVHIGGRDAPLKKYVSARLIQNGFRTNSTPTLALRGDHQNNLCNRGRRGKGVQLELSRSVRHRLIGRDHGRRPPSTPILERFAKAVRQAIRDYTRIMTAP